MCMYYMAPSILLSMLHCTELKSFLRLPIIYLKKWQVIPTSSTMPIAHKYPPFSPFSLLLLWYIHLAMHMCCHVFNFYVSFSSTFPRGNQAENVVLQPKIESGPQTLPILAKTRVSYQSRRESAVIPTCQIIWISNNNPMVYFLWLIGNLHFIKCIDKLNVLIY